MLEKTELKETDLKQVNGGAPDWKLFSQKLINSMSQYEGTITSEIKQLVELAKDKEYTQVAILAIKLASTDPFIAKLIMESDLKN